jgi:chromosome segregation ATPase
MSDETPHPERSRHRPSKSGVYLRKELAEAQMDAVADRLEHMDRGISQVLERLGRLDDLRADIDRVRSDVRELRNMVETMNREIEREQKRIEKHDERLKGLEDWRAEQRGERKARALVATGGGLAGGGFVAAGMEILRRLAGG